VFCGVLWCFAGVLWCFAGVLRYFASVLQYFHKTHKTPEKHRNTFLKNTGKHKKLTIRSCSAGVFQEQKNSTVLHKTHFSQNICKTPQNTKHRKTPQNSHKTRFVKLRRKTLQNARKTLENVTITKRSSQYSHNTYCAHSVCFLPKYARSVAKAYNTQYTRKLRRGVAYPQGVT